MGTDFPLLILFFSFLFFLLLGKIFGIIKSFFFIVVHVDIPMYKGYTSSYIPRNCPITMDT